MSEKLTHSNLFLEGHPLPEFERLVVLVPDADFDDIRLARRIRALMSPYKNGILLLSPASLEDETLSVQRRLTNLTAILHDPNYRVTAALLTGSRWLDQIEPCLLPGDLLVCLNGHKVHRRGLQKKSLVHALSERLPCPVYVLDSVPVHTIFRETTAHRMVGWLVPVMLISLFMVFDVDIARNATASWISTLLLWILLLVEAWLILGWNNLWD